MRHEAGESVGVPPLAVASCVAPTSVGMTEGKVLVFRNP
jgi:hypothetical protein